MRRVLDFARARIKKAAPEPEAVSLPAPPLLPLERPRPITPTKSTPVDVAHLGTLARLPAELRRKILITAFGKRAFHIDLRLVPRAWKPCHWNTGDSAHGRGSAPRDGIKPSFNPLEEHEWRWYGCVCHRQPPWSTPETYYWAHRDDCLQGQAAMCALYPSPPSMPGGSCDYIVGVLGWLCTCRQAYIEGVAVLYGSNNFIIESQDLHHLLLPSPEMTGRGHVLLPQHLAMVKSLEMCIDVVLFKKPGEAHNDVPHGHLVMPNLAALPTTFPNLNSLVISFSEYLYDDSIIRPRDRLPEIKSLLLQPLANAFAQFEASRPFIVELPIGVFKELETLEEFIKEPREHHFVDGWTWLRYMIPDPLKEVNEDDRDESTRFYYIKQGQEQGLYWDHEGRPRNYGVTYFAHHFAGE